MEDNQPGFNYGYVVVAAVFVIMAVIWGTFATFGVFFESFIKTPKVAKVPHIVAIITNTAPTTT